MGGELQFIHLKSKAKNIGVVRGIDIDSKGNILVVEDGAIKCYWFNQKNETESQFITQNVGLNDKLFIDEENKFM